MAGEEGHLIADDLLETVANVDVEVPEWIAVHLRAAGLRDALV